MSKERDTALSDRFENPSQIDDVDVAFPTSVHGYLPAWDELPEEFRAGWFNGNKWCDAASGWFGFGLAEMPKFREHINAKAALRHLSYCLGSWEPKHEHKIAGVGYLLSLWCKCPPKVRPHAG